MPERTPTETARDGDAPYVPRFHDEALWPDGRARPPYEQLIQELAGADLAAVATSLRRSVEALGLSFGDDGGTRPFHVDAVPRVLEAAEWNGLAAGMRQRARALNAFIADVYDERRIVAAGLVPSRVIDTAEGYEPQLQGVAPPGEHAPVVGFDLVRGGDGRFGVLEENLRTPSGVAFGSAARLAVDEAVPCAPPGERRDPGESFASLGEAIRAAAPGEGGDPSAALLSDGPSNFAWYEHGKLSRVLGIPIVTRECLHVRRGHLFAELEGGRPREIQVVYRRTDEDRLTDADGRPTWVAELLLDPYRRGKLGIVNAPGGGVGDDKLTHAYVGEMIRFYLGEEPLLPAVRTYDLGVSEVREEALKRLDELVVKPRAAYGGAGVVIGRHAAREELERVERRVREQPEALIAQETVSLSSHPTVVEGALEPRHIDLRAFSIGGAIVPGALTRVALRRGSLVVSSSRDGGGKDTWVLA